MRAAMSILALIASVLMCAAVLAGCTTTRTVVPQSLLHCMPQPVAPTGPGTTQTDVGIYIVDVVEAGADCRTKLNTVRGLLDVDPGGNP